MEYTLYQCRSLDTDWNLSAFQQWMHYQGDDTRRFVLSRVCTSLHRGPWLRDEDEQFEKNLWNILRFATNGEALNMRFTYCLEDDCPLCAKYIGEYVFNWVGPWTCTIAMDSLKAGCSREEGRKLWSECTSCAGCLARKGQTFL